jgi:hypothetical protein
MNAFSHHNEGLSATRSPTSEAAFPQKQMPRSFIHEEMHLNGEPRLAPIPEPPSHDGTIVPRCGHVEMAHRLPMLMGGPNGAHQRDDFKGSLQLLSPYLDLLLIQGLGIGDHDLAQAPDSGKNDRISPRLLHRALYRPQKAFPRIYPEGHDLFCLVTSFDFHCSSTP